MKIMRAVGFSTFGQVKQRLRSTLRLHCVYTIPLGSVLRAQLGNSVSVVFVEIEVPSLVW